MAPSPFPHLLIQAFHSCIGSSIRWLCTLKTFHTGRIPPCHPAGGAQRLRHFPSSYQAWCLRQDGIWGLHATLVEMQSKIWNKNLAISQPRTRCEAGMSQLGKPMRSRLAHRLSRGRERKGLFGFLNYRKIYCSHGKACEALELLSFWLGRQSSWKNTGCSYFEDLSPSSILYFGWPWLFIALLGERLDSGHEEVKNFP